MINYLKHNEIDKHKWDQCINHALNKLPYAMSWWLDRVSEGWEALVQDDYTAVMPLTCKSKIGFDYLYQPFFTQQLGVFSARSLNDNETSEFLDAIPARYRYLDIQLNYLNNPGNSGFQFKARANYILDLTADYTQLSMRYHRNCRRNIQKAIAARLSVKPGPGPSVFARFVQRNLDRKMLKTGKGMYDVMQQMIQTTIQKQCGEVLGVYKHSGELLATGWFVNSHGRCLFLVCASTGVGKQNQAMYLLIDHVIREKSGSAGILDFTGSNMPGVAYFNEGFGAVKSTYLAAKRNLLPWPVRLFKS